ncbi:MAG TPA: tRNA lysidine(34) synthetase TilS [Acidobacteriota bacterium]|nr:tRNA lysidine(34) synthetase TilS [Acidobacteriota bacterium]
MTARPNPRDATLDRLATRAIADHDLLPDAAAPIVVAVSGGADSMALLHALLAWARAEGRAGPVIAAHVNHRLREAASDEDASFVRERSEAWGAVPEIADAALAPRARARAATGAAIEADARRARYEALREIAARHGADRVITAHTADDQAETVLLRLVRGAGPRGLGGMAPSARVHGIRVVRPLLDVTRRCVLEYASRHRIPFREDASNAATAAARNYVRHELIPRIEARLNPAARDAILRAAAAIRETDRYLERRAARAYRSVRIERDEEKIILDAPKLLLYPKPLRTYVFRRAVRDLAGNLRDVAAVHLQALHQLVLARPGRETDLPGALRARRERDRLILALDPRRKQEPAPRKAPSKA